MVDTIQRPVVIVDDDITKDDSSSDMMMQTINNEHTTTTTIKTIDNADEYMLDIGSGLSLWFRTWGNRPDGIPVLFVHGGPGSSVKDYNNINSKFFEATKFFVIEIDQRGTGRSQPSVRDDYRNMRFYKDISIEQMANDFEIVRKFLNIDKWLVFGGSWGSTLGLEYTLRYPEHCLGLIIRGIFLDSCDEFNAIYSRKSFENNPRRLHEFDIFFELAASEARRRGEPTLHPSNDSERFIRLYESMIIQGNRDAIWRFFVFENNLMEDDPTKLLDPYTVPSSEEEDDGDDFKEALSISFFESRLFLRGTFEEPINLLSRLSLSMKNTPIWIVQGTGDEVCPDIYAKQLIGRLESIGMPPPQKAYFVNDGGHTANTGGMFHAVKACVNDFASTLISRVATTEEGFLPLSRIVTNDDDDNNNNNDPHHQASASSSSAPMDIGN